MRKSELAERMKRAAEQAGLTQQQIADQLGMGLTTVNRWLNGKQTPGSDDLRRYAEVVGKSVAALEGEDEEASRVAARFLLRALELAGLGGSISQEYDSEFLSGWLPPDAKPRLDRLGPRVIEGLAAQEGRPWSEIDPARQRELLMAWVLEVTGIDLSPEPNGRQGG